MLFAYSYITIFCNVAISRNPYTAIHPAVVKGLLESGFPMCRRVIREMHAVLLETRRTRAHDAKRHAVI